MRELIEVRKIERMFTVTEINDKTILDYCDEILMKDEDREVLKQAIEFILRVNDIPANTAVKEYEDGTIRVRDMYKMCSVHIAEHRGGVWIRFDGMSKQFLKDLPLVQKKGVQEVYFKLD